MKPSKAEKKDLKGPKLCAKLGWVAPCEAAFGYLAENHPKDLRDWVLSNELSVADLTFASEALGRVSDSTLVISALRWLSTHEDDLVREGVLLGLYKLGTPQSIAVIQRVMVQDPSETIRAIAEDLLS